MLSGTARPGTVVALAALLLLPAAVRGGGDGARPPVRADRPVTRLTLEEALRELEAQNLTVEQARGRLGEASGVARQALAASFPALTATAGYTRNSAVAVVTPPAPPGATAAPIVIQPLDALSVGATLRVPLVAPSRWAEAAAARSAARGVEAELEAVRLEARSALVRAAWAASAGEEIVAASARAVASAEEQAQSARRALDAGTGVPLAVLQARTEAVKRRSDLARATADAERARLVAGVLLGRAEPVLVAMPRTLAGEEMRDAAALVEEGRSRRPELRARREQVEAGERLRDAARLRLVPELSASASLFAQDEPFPTGRKEGWRVTLELVWPLYDGGARYGRGEQAEGAIRSARAALLAQELAVAQEVEDAVREVRVGRERLELAEQEAALAGEAAATARRAFAGGVASSLDVLDANDRLYRSEVGLAEARARLGISLAALDHALGRS